MQEELSHEQLKQRACQAMAGVSACGVPLGFLKSFGGF